MSGRAGSWNGEGPATPDRREGRRRRILHALAVLVAAGGLAWFGWVLAGTDALERVGELLPLLLVMLPIWAVMVLLCTLSWALSFPDVEGSRRPRFRTLWSIRMAGEAVNNLLLSAYVAGEPVKGALVARHGVTPAVGIASVVVGKTTFTLGEMLFVAVGAAGAAIALGGANGIVLPLLVTAAGGIAVAFAGVWFQRRRLFARSTLAARSLRLGPRRLWDRALPGAEAVDEAAERYYSEQRRDFVAATLLAGLGWTFGALELYVFFLVVGGVPHPLATALALEAGIAVSKGVTFFVPASIGVQEAAITWLFQAMGLGVEQGAVYAVLRRLRELVWNALGLGLLAWHLRSAAEEPVPAGAQAGDAARRT